MRGFDYSLESVRVALDKCGLFDVRLSFFDEIDSTNLELKRRFGAADSQKPILCVAKSQTAGKGRMGRSFLSPDAGVYMSLLLPTESSGAILTAYAAVMVAEAVEELSGAVTEIKWVNDIYLSGRKLSGILCEGLIDIKTGALRAAVVGIGINVLKTEFPKEISDVAVSLEEVTGKRFSRAKLVARVTEKLIKELPQLTSRALIEKYKSKSNVLGKRVFVTRGDESFFAKAVDINEKAELVVLNDAGQSVCLNSGEVSVRTKFDN